MCYFIILYKKLSFLEYIIDSYINKTKVILKKCKTVKKLLYIIKEYLKFIR